MTEHRVTEYREFVDADYTRLRKSLLAKKGGSRQKNFLVASRDSLEFAGQLSGEVGVRGSVDVELAAEPMTENEFAAPPADTEARLYESWSGLSAHTACRTTFWANVTCRHVREGRIESAYLAADGSDSAGGAARIDRALHLNGEARAKEIDACVRTILRRLGGIPEARGKRTVYVDCPFARAWWREWLVRQIARGDDSIAGSVRAVVRINQTYWEKIVDRIVSRNSTFGCASVRAAFIRALAGAVDDDPASGLRTPKVLIRACRRVAAHQAIRELSILSDDELNEIMAEVVKPA